MSRYAAKVDSNQKVIMTLLRSEGLSVFNLSGNGMGCPDLVCGYTHPETGVQSTYLVEVKDGSRYSAQATDESMLTSFQKAFIKSWTGTPVVVIKDEDSAMAWVREIKR